MTMSRNSISGCRSSRCSQKCGSVVCTARFLCLIIVVMALPGYGQLPGTGPVRIDCGNTEGGFTFKDGDLEWFTDYGFQGGSNAYGFTGGTNHTLEGANLPPDLSKEYRTLRAFDFEGVDIPVGVRLPDEAYIGCYRVYAKAGNYLVRAGFAHFGYDGNFVDPSMAVTINDVPVQKLFFSWNQTFYTSWIVNNKEDILRFCLRKLDTVPFINFLEVLPQDKRAYDVDATGNVVLSMHLRLNVGGGDITESEDPGYRLWDSDTRMFDKIVGGNPVADTLTTKVSTTVLSTINPPYLFYSLPQKFFQTARKATPLSNGVLSVTFDGVMNIDKNYFLVLLYFSEIDPDERPNVGDRVFDIIINNQTVRQNFDILREAGAPNTGIIVNFTTKLVDDDTLDIRLVRAPTSTFYPMLSGIEAHEIIKEQPEPDGIIPNMPVRIDCGGPVSHRTSLGYEFLYDRGYSSGYPAVVDDLAMSNDSSPTNTLRYFPEGDSNCYVITLPSGTELGPYIVRPTFHYGNYDDNTKAPTFIIAVQGAFVYSNFTVPVSGSDYGRHEVITPVRADGTISICFITADKDDAPSPFVNSLEFLPQKPGAYDEYIRDMEGGVYAPDKWMMVLVARLNCGDPTFGDGVENITMLTARSGLTGPVTIPSGMLGPLLQDPGFRVWHKDVFFLPNGALVRATSGKLTYDGTRLPIVNPASRSPHQFPNKLYETARTSTGTPALNGGLIYNIPLGPEHQDGASILCLLHFAELVQLAAPGKRTFQILINSQKVLDLDVARETGGARKALVKKFWCTPPERSRKNILIELKSNPGSMYAPMISGIEIFRMVPMATPTLLRDATVMQILKASLRMEDDAGWQGDPCNPIQWFGLTCQDGDPQGPAITSIVVPGENTPPLNGTIPSEIGDLAQLTELALTGLGLQGSIPDTIGKLMLLTRLDLSNNNLSGQIPGSIMMMKERSPNLLINLVGNPLLCGGLGYQPCGAGRGGLSAGGIVGIVLALVFVAAVALAVLVVWRRRRAAYAFQRMDSGLSDSDILKGPDTVGAGTSERRRATNNPRSMKLPPRSNSSLGRSDSFSSTGSSSRFSQQRQRDIMDVELNSHDSSLLITSNGNGNGHGGGRGGSRLRPQEDVNYVGYDG